MALCVYILKFVQLGTRYFKDILQIKTCCFLTNIMNLFKIINAILSIVFIVCIRKYIIYCVFYDDTLKIKLYLQLVLISLK